MASVKARADGKSRIAFNVENVAQFAFLPDPHVVDTSQPLEVSVNGGPVFTGEIADGKELAIVEGHGAWKASLRAQTKESLTAYRNHPVAVAPKRLDMLGHEASLANWITDAMRDATGADVAIYNRQFYRGEPISAGVVDIVDLIQCSKPFDQYLVTVKLTGRELLEILDDNVPDPSKDRPSRWDRPGAGRLVQVSGARYRFDPKLPSGRRIVWSTLRPDQRYSVVMGGEVVDRQTILLAGRFGKLPYTVTDTPFTMALYGYAAKSGRIEARFEGRVRQVENGVGERLAGPHPNR